MHIAMRLSPARPRWRKQPVCLRDFNASRNASFVPAVSALALIILVAPEASFAHDGISPQHITDNSRTGSLGFWRMTGIGWVGAML